MSEQQNGINTSGIETTFGNVENERTAMLKQFRGLVVGLQGFFYEFKPCGPNIGELFAWMFKIDFALQNAAFVGLVVSESPPEHIDFSDLCVNVFKQDGPKQNPAFCAWFRNIPRLEVTEAKEGDTAFRLTQITPRCTAVPVKFYARYGWLTESEVGVLD